MKEKLNPDQPLILLKLQLAVGSFSSQLNSIVAPLRELRLAHFLFHIASVVLLVCAVVYLPHGITLELVLEGATHGDVTAGLWRVTAYESLAVV